MEKIEYIKFKRQELVNVAKTILNDEIELINGVRKICLLRFEIGDPDNSIFLIFRGVETETEIFPFEEERLRYSKQYLEQMDIEKKNYLLNIILK